MNIERFDKSESVLAKQYFDEFGFVIIKNGIDKPTLNDFKQELLRIIRAYLSKANISEEISDEQILHKGMELLEDSDHMFVASIYDTISLSPAFLRIVSSGLIEKFVCSLLEKPDAPLYGYTNRCLIAPPFDTVRTYDWHQEVFYTVPRGSFIQTWAPLISDTSVSNGTIQVAIGSHREGIAKQTWTEIDGRASYPMIDDEIIAKYDQLSVEMKLGELMLFSGYLAHRSGTNSSDKHRYSLVGMYHDVSTQEFIAPSVDLNHRGQTPEEYFNSHFEKIV